MKLVVHCSQCGDWIPGALAPRLLRAAGGSDERAILCDTCLKRKERTGSAVLVLVGKFDDKPGF